jgi:voltage-gated potassium channel Kch
MADFPLTKNRPRLVALLAAGASLILLSGGGFAAFEDQTVSNYWEGLWWALSLMTTVGFVGESPETAAGRIISAILMVSGFMLMTLVTASISSVFVQREQEPEFEAEGDFEARALELLEILSERLDALEARAFQQRADGAEDT